MKNRHRSIFYIELIIEGEQIKRFINMCRKDDITLYISSMTESIKTA